MLTDSFTPLSYLVFVCVSFFSLYLVFSCLPHFLFSPTESSCQWVMSLIQSCCKVRLNSMQTSRNFIHLDLTVCNPKLLFAIIDTDTVSQLRSCILGGVNLKNAIWLGLFIFNYRCRYPGEEGSFKFNSHATNNIYPEILSNILQEHLTVQNLANDSSIKYTRGCSTSHSPFTHWAQKRTVKIKVKIGLVYSNTVKGLDLIPGYSINSPAILSMILHIQSSVLLN